MSKKKRICIFLASIALFLCLKTGCNIYELCCRGIDRTTQILFTSKYWNLWEGRDNITFTFEKYCGQTTAKFKDEEMKVIIRTKNGLSPAEECRMDGNERVLFAKKFTISKYVRYYPSEPECIYVSCGSGNYKIYSDKRINSKEEVQELEVEDYQMIEFFHMADIHFRRLLKQVRNIVLLRQIVILFLLMVWAGVFLKLANNPSKEHKRNL